MKTLLVLPLLLLTIVSFSQTDIIDLRSRSASLKSYKKATDMSKFDHVSSNFGMAPMPEVRTAVLDSVKALSDTVAVMYTSNYCSRSFRQEPLFYLDSNGEQHSLQSPSKVRPNPRVGHLWQPGVDTVFFHPLFSRRHSLDSVKRVIDDQYYFNLPSDSIRFIGFDNSQQISNKDAVYPVKNRREKKNGIGWELMFMILSPLVLFLGMSRYLIPSASSKQ